jgi:hypothetical protein
MAVPTRLTDFSATAASNSPTGSEAVGTSLDDYLRGYQAVVRLDLASKGSDIASATTTDIAGTSGFFNDITGTTTITGLGTVATGIHKVIKFEGALQLTHNATSLILPGGANITTADGDIGWFISEGSGNWRCISYQRASGKPVVQLTSGTVTATTSGTEHDFTSIPAWVKRITVMFNGVSTDGTEELIVQLGDSGGIETTGYISNVLVVRNATDQSEVPFTTGFAAVYSGLAASSYSGSMVITLLDSTNNIWTYTSNVAEISGGVSVGTQIGGGAKSLSATLTQIRITTTGTPDDFDAGSVNIIYE